MKFILAVVAFAIIVFSPPAKADDFPVFPPAYYGQYNWSGLYFGGQFGGARDHIDNRWSQTDHYFLAGTSISTEDSAIAGGGQIGYQKQWGNWLLGVEAGALKFSDLDTRVSTRDNVTFPALGNGSPSGIEDDVQWALTFTPRLGYAWDRWLVYAKGGYALTEIRTTTVQCCTPIGVVSNPFVNPLATTKDDEWHGGWVAGGGIEFALTNYASFGVDYQHIFINDEIHSGVANSAFVLNPPLNGRTNVGGDIDTVVARLNFRFGGEPEPVPVPLK